MLERQTAAVVGTCWPWETAATLPSARRHKAVRRPRGRRGAGHIVAYHIARLQLVYLDLIAAAHTYGRNVGRRVVAMRSNRGRIVVVTNVLATPMLPV